MAPSPLNQPACKPGSVRRCLHRVTAIPLGRRLPVASSNLPGRQDPDTGPATCAARRPYSVLLPVGFAVPLPLPEARCALTAPFHPYRSPCGGGGLLLCGTFPGLWRRFASALSPAGRYPAPHVHGARTFLPRRLSALARAAVRPTDATDLGALRDQIKQSRMKPLTIAAALPPSIGRRGRRRARGGSDAGTP